jgi:hypothetical protein
MGRSAQEDIEPISEPLEAQTEGEEDLDEASLQRLGEAVVSGSDWTTETILRQLERGNIILNPDYQRRDAWRASRKSRFIESLILGLPIPQLVLAESRGKKGKFIVIDGKQRLLTLRQFASTPDDKAYPQLTLEGLEVRKDLNDQTIQKLETNTNFADDLTAFQNQTIRTVVIKGWPNESVLYLIFLRLNTGSVQLSPQELRRALHPGPFVSFADERSATMIGLQRILKTTKPDFRMRDVELFVRYYAFRNYLREYKGNLKGFLDTACKTLNRDWADREREIKKQSDDLETAIDTTFKIFGERNSFRKWDGKKYEGRFNRAIYDLMTFYFSEPSVRRKAITGKAGVEADFRKLCSSNNDFVKSIEVTTKSIDATVTRLGIWGKTLAKRLDLKLAVPRVVGNSIKL